jgi:nitrous oxidase accessory protein NosD
VLTVNALYDTYASIILKNGGKLITTGGGEIKFYGNAQLIIENDVEVSGTPANKLTLDFVNKNKGIYLRADAGLIISNCIIKNANAGILNQAEVGTLKIMQNEFQNCKNGIILQNIENSSPLISYNVFRNIDLSGINLKYLSECTISSNDIVAFLGIWADYVANPIIINNSINAKDQDLGVGIYLHSCPGGLIRKDTIQNFRTGIRLSQSSPQIGMNVIKDNYDYGMAIISGSSPDFRLSYINNNGTIYLYPISGYNKIFNNGNSDHTSGAEISILNSFPLLNSVIILF